MQKIDNSVLWGEYDRNPGKWVEVKVNPWERVIEWHGGRLVAVSDELAKQLQANEWMVPWSLEWVCYCHVRDCWLVCRT